MSDAGKDLPFLVFGNIRTAALFFVFFLSDVGTAGIFLAFTNSKYE